jgi:hypothetical protein
MLSHSPEQRVGRPHFETGACSRYGMVGRLAELGKEGRRDAEIVGRG